jgi:hypothetical protein
MSFKMPLHAHSIERGCSPSLRPMNVAMLTVLAIAGLCMFSFGNGVGAMNGTAVGPLPPKRNGTMMLAKQTAGEMHRVPPIDALAHSGTETATFALG